GGCPCPPAAVAPAGGSPSHWRSLLAGAIQPTALAGTALQVVVPAGDHCPIAGGLRHSRLPLCRGPWPQSAAPLQVGRLWPTAPAGGLAMASHPCRWPSHGLLPLVLAAFAAKT
ncbi:hypothetical protein BHE74_00022610, partial [Ensete ventricosum]